MNPSVQYGCRVSDQWHQVWDQRVQALDTGIVHKNSECAGEQWRHRGEALGGEIIGITQGLVIPRVYSLYSEYHPITLIGPSTLSAGH